MKKIYRKMVGYLNAHHDILNKIGLSKSPSKNTIWSAYGMIPESYLYDIHQKIISGIQVGSVAGDSTGYSNNGSVRWFSVRHDMSMAKRGWIKLHHTIDISTKAILEYGITDGYASDITSMRPLMDRFGGFDVKDNFFRLDSAYLARRVCGMIASKSWLPRILPKSNTTCKNGGSQALYEMTRLHRDNNDQFMDEYHQRSIIESIFGSLKKMHGNTLRSRRFKQQSMDVAIRIICYNIEVVARSHIKTGILTPKSLGRNSCLTVSATSAMHIAEHAHYSVNHIKFCSYRHILMKCNALKLPQSQEFGQCQYRHVANDAWRGICLWDTAGQHIRLKYAYAVVHNV